MKFTHFISIVILSLFSNTIFSQELKSKFRVGLSQTVDISDYKNQKFKLTAFLRVDKNNSKSSVIYIYGVTNNSENEFIKYFIDENAENLIKNNNWTKSTINGTFSEDATTLKLGAACMNNGTFYYDSFKLEVQDENENWKSIKIDNPEFEDKIKKKNHIWNNDNLTKVREFSSKLSYKNPYQGKKCLSIIGKNVVGENDIVGEFVDVNGVKLYYETYGSGEPLILLHGAGGSITSFINQIHFFSKKYKVIIIDSRGRGNSTDNNEELTYINQAKDINFFMEKLNIESAHILGWSDGGIIGLILAMQHPEKVKKLIAFGANINPEGIFTERLEYHKNNLKKYRTYKEIDTTIIHFKVLKQLIKYPNLKFESLKKITAPCLIMAGDHDVIKDIHTVKIYQSIPNAYLAILPGETHWFPEKKSKHFNEMALKFLTEEFKKPKRY